MERVAPKPKMLETRKRLDHYFPHELTKRITPVDTLFTTSTLGIPDVSIEDWALEITGLIENSKSFSYSELLALPKRTLETVHVCSGNPKKPTTPLRRASNVRWSGVDLAELLKELGVDKSATHIWSYGLDFGEEEGDDFGAIAHYVKDMPLSRLEDGDILVAYELNDEPLNNKNGFPARLVIPGYYGTNSTKWLCRLEVTDRRPDSYHTTVVYNDPDYDADPSGKITKPVWHLAPECLFASHKKKCEIPNKDTELWGWAWSNCSAEYVDVSVDGGKTWHGAELETPNGRTWQQFSFNWTPDEPGEHDVRCRTRDVNGNIQPEDNARNLIQSITITVSD